MRTLRVAAAVTILAAAGAGLSVVLTASAKSAAAAPSKLLVGQVVFKKNLATLTWLTQPGAVSYSLIRNGVTLPATSGPGATSARFAVSGNSWSVAAVANFQPPVTTTTAPTTTVGTTTTTPVTGTAWYVDPNATGSSNGSSWVNAWRSFATIGWGSVKPGDTVFISGGTYSSPLTVPISGASDAARVTVRVGQDAGHNEVVTLNANLDISNQNYVTVDGEFNGAQHLRVVNANIISQGNTNPVIRYLEGDGSPVSAQYGVGGDFDHLYIHDISDDCAVCFAARDQGVTQYDRTILENSHVAVNAQPSANGSGSDGVQGCPGCTVRNTFLEGFPAGAVSATQHQDLIQSQSSWFSAYGDTFKDGADSSFDYDCYNGSAPNHFRIFNNVFIKARGGSNVRFYASGGTHCTSFDNIHVDNNTLVDSVGTVGNGIIAFYGFNGNPTVANSEIANNIVYNSSGDGPAIEVDASTGFTAADWHVDYNDISGGSHQPSIDGAAYTQAHGLTCVPAFAGYVPDSNPYSTAPFTSNLHLAASDSCVADRGVPLSGLFTVDKDGTPRPQGAGWDVGAYER